MSLRTKPIKDPLTIISMIGLFIILGFGFITPILARFRLSYDQRSWYGWLKPESLTKIYGDWSKPVWEALWNPFTVLFLIGFIIFSMAYTPKENKKSEPAG